MGTLPSALLRQDAAIPETGLGMSAKKPEREETGCTKKRPGDGSPGHVDVTGEGENDIYAPIIERSYAIALSPGSDFFVAGQRSAVVVPLQRGAAAHTQATPATPMVRSGHGPQPHGHTGVTGGV